MPIVPSAQDPRDASVATVVILHPGSLGDILLAVPAMRRLRATFPHCELCLCANEPVARFLAECREIDRWIPIDGAQCGEMFAGSVSGQLGEWLARCDLFVAWLKDAEGIFAVTARKHGARDVRIGSPSSASMTAVHQRDRFLELLGESPDCMPPAHLALPEALRRRGRTFLSDVGMPVTHAPVIVHPGSGSPHKCVGPQTLAVVMERLGAAGTVPIVLEGPADRDSVEALLRHTGVQCFVLRHLDLPTLAGLLAEARLFLGHDSGVTHLSALLGVPTVALFGPTDPERWAPIGRRVRVLRGGSCSCPDWEKVRRCQDKPCLEISAGDIVDCCLTQRG